MTMYNYRPNVAALFIKENGSLLICERSNILKSWQFPQGGVDDGESLEDALFREVREEIGLSPQHYKIIEHRGGYRYLYPLEAHAKKVLKHGNHGQEQTYFLCQLLPGAPDINVNQTPQEFGAYRWIQPSEFDIEWLPAFKREVYRAVFHDFFQITFPL